MIQIVTIIRQFTRHHNMARVTAGVPLCLLAC